MAAETIVAKLKATLDFALPSGKGRSQIDELLRNIDRQAVNVQKSLADARKRLVELQEKRNRVSQTTVAGDPFRKETVRQVQAQEKLIQNLERQKTGANFTEFAVTKLADKYALAQTRLVAMNASQKEQNDLFERFRSITSSLGNLPGGALGSIGKTLKTQGVKFDVALNDLLAGKLNTGGVLETGRFAAFGKQLDDIATRSQQISQFWRKINVEHVKFNQYLQSELQQLTQQNKQADFLLKKADARRIIIDKRNIALEKEKVNAEKTVKGLGIEAQIKSILRLGNANVRLSGALQDLRRETDNTRQAEQKQREETENLKKTIRELRQEISNFQKQQEKLKRTPPVEDSNLQKLEKFSLLFRNLQSATVLAVGPLSGLGARLQSFGAIVGRTDLKTGILIGTLAAFASASFIAVKAMIRVKRALEGVRVILELTSAATQKQGESFEEISQAAIDFGLNLSTIGRQLAKLKVAVRASGLGTDFEDLARSIGAISGRFELDGDQQQRFIRAIEQMFSKGIVQAEEFRQQLGDVIPGSAIAGLKAFREITGRADATMRDFMEEMRNNRILTDDFMPKFIRFFKEMFGITNADRVDTLNAAFGRLRTSTDLFILKLDDIIGFTEVLKDVMNAVSAVLNFLRQNLDSVALGFKAVVAIVSTLMALRMVQVLVAWRAQLALVTGVLGKVGFMLGILAAAAAAIAALTVALGVFGAMAQTSSDGVAQTTENVRALSQAEKEFNKAANAQKFVEELASIQVPEKVFDFSAFLGTKAVLADIEDVKGSLRDLARERSALSIADPGDISDSAIRDLGFDPENFSIEQAMEANAFHTELFQKKLVDLQSELEQTRKAAKKTDQTFDLLANPKRFEIAFFTFINQAQRLANEGIKLKPSFDLEAGIDDGIADLRNKSLRIRRKLTSVLGKTGQAIVSADSLIDVDGARRLLETLKVDASTNASRELAQQVIDVEAQRKTLESYRSTLIRTKAEIEFTSRATSAMGSAARETNKWVALLVNSAGEIAVVVAAATAALAVLRTALNLTALGAGKLGKSISAVLNRIGIIGVVIAGSAAIMSAFSNDASDLEKNLADVRIQADKLIKKFDEAGDIDVSLATNTIRDIEQGIQDTERQLKSLRQEQALLQELGNRPPSDSLLNRLGFDDIKEFNRSRELEKNRAQVEFLLDTYVELQEKLKGVQSILRAFEKQVLESNRTFFQSTFTGQQAIRDLNNEIIDMETEIGSISGTMSLAAQESDKFAKKQAELSRRLFNARVQTEEANEVIKRYMETWKELQAVQAKNKAAELLEEARLRNEGLKNGTLESLEAQKRLNESVDKYKKLLFEAGTRGDELNQKVAAFRALMQENLDLSGKDAKSKVEKTLEGIQAVQKGLEGFTTQLAELASQGRLTFESFGDAFAKMAQKMIADILALILKLNIVLPLVKSLQAGGANAGIGSFLESAINGAGLSLFAKGGIIGGPTLLAGKGGLGLAGEAGAEAILPLTRGPGGRLGVEAMGGGAPININFNVQAQDAESFIRNEGRVTAMLNRALTRGRRNQ